MKYYQILLLIFVSTTTAAAEKTGDGFWENCPGPACPANTSSPMEPRGKDSPSNGVEKSNRHKSKTMDLDMKRKEEATKSEKINRKDAKP